MKRSKGSIIFVLVLLLASLGVVLFNAINNSWENDTEVVALQGQDSTPLPTAASPDPYAATDPLETIAPTVLPTPEPTTPTPVPVQLVEYKGLITNIFFHPLIAFPEKAFDGIGNAQAMQDWFVTVTEFNRIIDTLYKDNYILIDIRSVYEKKTENGKEVLVRKTLMLPEGKKPLIISIDDLNYYKYMKENGTVHKLILDEQGNVVTFTQFPDEKPIISYDYSIPTILEKFVNDHPDFSHQGAKGVIALTGYNGVLGYNTHLLSSAGYENEKNSAIAVIERLKQMGWAFASHGYSHLDAGQTSVEKLAADNKRWHKEAGVLTGPTELYIYPYGATVTASSGQFKEFLSSGFNVFWGVGSNSMFYMKSNYLIMDRYHIDGKHFEANRGKVTLFDVETVIDKARGWE